MAGFATARAQSPNMVKPGKVSETTEQTIRGLGVVVARRGRGAGQSPLLAGLQDMGVGDSAVKLLDLESSRADGSQAPGR